MDILGSLFGGPDVQQIRVFINVTGAKTTRSVVWQVSPSDAANVETILRQLLGDPIGEHVIKAEALQDAANNIINSGGLVSHSHGEPDD